MSHRESSQKRVPGRADKSQPAITEFQRVVALHSPNGTLETGLPESLAEKIQDTGRLCCRAVRSLQSGLCANNREIRALFAYFGAKGERNFSAVQTCVAEGEGFEPPVPFQVQRFSRPPVSTTHTSLRTGKRIYQIVYNGITAKVQRAVRVSKFNPVKRGRP